MIAIIMTSFLEVLISQILHDNDLKYSIRLKSDPINSIIVFVKMDFVMI